MFLHKYLLLLRWFLKIYISQGSVATQLRCGGIISNQFLTNFPQNVPVKKIFENRSIFGEDMDKSMWLSFLGPSCRFFKSLSMIAGVDYNWQDCYRHQLVAVTGWAEVYGGVGWSCPTPVNTSCRPSVSAPKKLFFSSSFWADDRSGGCRGWLLNWFTSFKWHRNEPSLPAMHIRISTRPIIIRIIITRSQAVARITDRRPNCLTADYLVVVAIVTK